MVGFYCEMIITCVSVRYWDILENCRLKRFYIILSVYIALVFQGIIGGYMAAMPLSMLGSDQTSERELSSQNVIPAWICRTGSNSDGAPIHPSDDECEICLQVAGFNLHFTPSSQLMTPIETGTSHATPPGSDIFAVPVRGRHLARAPPLTIA